MKASLRGNQETLRNMYTCTLHTYTHVCLCVWHLNTKTSMLHDVTQACMSCIDQAYMSCIDMYGTQLVCHVNHNVTTALPIIQVYYS